MPANEFGRYVWLIDTLRHYGHLTYKEIINKWQQSGLSYGDGETAASCALFITIARRYLTSLTLSSNSTLT